jgi:type III pantothenate kinase
MLLAIDAGNTNVVFAVYNGNEAAHIWRCQTNSGRTADEYAAWLYQLFSRVGMSFDQIDDAIISSVVPDANFHLTSLCRQNFNCDPICVSNQSADLKIKLDKPSEVGADRIVNAIAVQTAYQKPAIVIDFGTATTFDIIDAEGAYCGGAIAPGVNLSMSALHQAAAKLPKIAIQKTDSAIGHDTVSAMQAGVYWGYVGLVEGILKRTTAEMGLDFYVIATGGLSSLFAEAIPDIDMVDKDLTLRGLLHIYNQHKQQRLAA